MDDIRPGNLAQIRRHRLAVRVKKPQLHPRQALNCQTRSVAAPT